MGDSVPSGRLFDQDADSYAYNHVQAVATKIESQWKQLGGAADQAVEC